MKKILILAVLMVHVNTTQPLPIRPTPFGTLISQITNHIAFRACRAIGYIGTVCCLGYLAARYLNDYRNSSRHTVIQHTPPSEKKPLETVTITTDGLTTIKAQDEARAVTIHTERLNPDSQHFSLLANPASEAPHDEIHRTRWQRFWHWLVRPSYRAVVRNTISVPRNINIILNTRTEFLNSHKTEHPLQPAIVIDGVNGNIEARTNSGDIRITNPGGNVTVGTPDHVEIKNFGGSVEVEDFGSLNLTRREGNALGKVSFEGRIQEI